MRVVSSHLQAVACAMQLHYHLLYTNAFANCMCMHSAVISAGFVVAEAATPANGAEPAVKKKKKKHRESTEAA